mmetsp:Transcript_821/g.1327  ORF Transcript_821/g.1327 Transcript_821/m.1327 type:complete len:156 (-) Transcript_821:452-919(-)
MLVHDLSNSVSRRNLDKWKQEWLNYYNSSSSNPNTSSAYSQVVLPPTLTVGNKVDLNPQYAGQGMEMESGDSECSASARRTKLANSPATYEGLMLQLDAFVDKVLEFKERGNGPQMGVLGGQGMGLGLSERRTASSQHPNQGAMGSLQRGGSHDY